MRYIFILAWLFCMCCHQGLTAQNTAERRFQGGIMVGGNFGQIQGDKVAGFRKLGLTAGLRVAILIKEKIDLGVSLMYSQRGSAESRPGSGVLPYKFQLNYVEVPLIVNIKDWKDEEDDYYKVHFHAGASYGRLFSYKTDSPSFENLSEFFRDNDVSLIGGATFYINEHWGFTGRYTRSVTPFFKSEGDGTIVNAKSMFAYQISLHTVYMF